jgi:hypothetical protein
MQIISTRNSVDGNLPASVNAVWGLTNSDMVIATCNTERMRITNRGFVGINNTNPTTLFNITMAPTATSKTAITSFGTCGLLYLSGLQGTTNSEIGFFAGNDYSSLSAGIGIARANSGNWNTQLRFYTHISSTGGSPDDISEKMRIDGDGPVSISCCLSVGSSADASGGFGTMVAYQPYGAASFSCNLNTLADGTYIVTASMVRGGGAINETYSAMWVYHHYANSGGTDIINTIVSSTAPGNNNGALSLSGTTVSIGWGGARGPASISALRLRTS